MNSHEESKSWRYSGVISDDRKTVFSSDRVYRYTLWREWGIGALPIWEHVEASEKYVQFIGLNPSTADETKNDPTIRRCIDFAKRWGFGALCMTNLFGYRDTDPNGIKRRANPCGLDNIHWIKHVAKNASLIIAAWGTHGHHNGQDNIVLSMLREQAKNVHVLGLTAGKHPKHPLYLPKTSKPVLYSGVIL